MKKSMILLSVVLSVILLGTPVLASMAGAFQTLKTQYPDIVERLNNGGASNNDIINFLNDVEQYIKNNGVVLTESNFDKEMLEAMKTVIYYKSNLNVFTAIAQEFSSEAYYLVINNEFPDSLKPVYHSAKEFLIINDSGNPGSNPGSGSNPTTPPDDNSPAPTPVDLVFSDCAGVPWAVEAINYLSAKNIIDGYGDGTFKPDRNITRAEFTKLVVTAFGMHDTISLPDFKDVEADKWYSLYIGSALNHGIITGYEDGTFRPNDLISRQDIAVIVYRAAKARNVTFKHTSAAAEFTDTEEIAPYALPAIKEMSSAGIINGMGNNTFSPLLNATRAQASKIIYLSMEK